MATTTKKIRAKLDFSKISHTDLLSRLNAVHDGMDGNDKYPKPPVDMATLKTAGDNFGNSITEALDGGKKAISNAAKQREAVITMLTLLGHYVEAVANDDPAVFNTSGFVAKSTVRNTPQPLPPATIDWIDRGPISGQLLVRVTSLAGARSYELRYGQVSNGGTPASWVTVTLTSSKTTTIGNLTPGATYQFQVRALGKLGYTDWSETSSFISG